MKSLYTVASNAKKSLMGQTTHAVLENYYKKFEKYSFVDGEHIISIFNEDNSKLHSIIKIKETNYMNVNSLL